MATIRKAPLSFQILVELRGSRTPIYSQSFDTLDEAKQDIERIKQAKEDRCVPDVPWMAVSGEDILGAQIIDHDDTGVS